ncbi:MAG: XRE family transcriptional regulator [Chloroflexota bacterium]|nr:XRE family transcriptional regulator [Chloroflexota bacterium]
MKRGIASFVGARLRLARELRSIASASSLADMLEVSRQLVSQYETGKARPTPEQLERIATTLNVPVGFFLKPVPEAEGQQPFFRSMAASVAVERRRARALLVLLADIADHLLEFVELPVPDLPRKALPGSFRLWSDEQVETVAADIRRALGVRSGPLPNLTVLLEHRGAVIGRDHLADRELEGLSNWLNGRPFVLLNTTKSPARSRLDLAHELGHLVLHPGVDSAVFDDARAFKLIERQAFRFGGALLLPREEFEFEIVTGSLDELLGMKARWQVSVGAMIYRIQDLGVLPAATVASLWRRYRRSGWHVKEPLEDAVRLEQPTVLKSSMELLRDQGGMLAGDIVEQSNAPGIDLLRLAGLGSDFLASSLPSNVVRLHERARGPN